MPSRAEKSTRRDPALPGIASIAIEDFHNYEGGRTSIQALADRAGVSRQAVASLFRRRGWNSSASTTASLSPAASAVDPPTPAAPPPEIADHDELKEHVAAELARGDLLLLGLTVRQLQHWHDGNIALGASQLKSLTAALTGLRGNLIVAGLAPTPDDERRPVELIVRTLTADQETEIRRQSEAGDELNGDDDLGDDLSAILIDDKMPSGKQLSASAAGEASARIINDPLPADPAQFEKWLRWLARIRGDQILRKILAELTGSQSTGDASGLVARIIALCAGDPARLKTLAV